MMRHDKSPVPPPMDGFEFKQRVEPIDWRTIASLEIDDIIKNVDIACLQAIIDNLTFCDVTRECRSKLSEIIQVLSIDHGDYIMENRNSIKSEIKNYVDETQSLKEKLSLKESHNVELTREIKGLKKTLYAYQLMAKMPGGLGENAHASVASYYRCDYCPKVFNSGYHLENHLYRRHGDKLPERANNVLKENNLKNGQMQNQTLDLQKITDTVEHFSARVIDSERQFRKELEDKMEAKLSEEIKRRQLLLEEGYQQERIKHIQEIQQLKSNLHAELSQEKLALEEQRRLIEKFMENNRPSSFGRIEDDDDVSKISQIIKSTSEKQTDIKHYTHAEAIEPYQHKSISKTENSVKNDIKEDSANNAEIRNMEIRLDAALNEINVLQRALVDEHSKHKFKQSDEKPAVIAIKDDVSSSKVVKKTENRVVKKVSMVAQESTSETWDQILEKLKLFNEISNPKMPWAKNLFSHQSELEIIKMRKIMEEDLKQSLENAGIDENYVIENWGKDDELEEKIQTICREKALKTEYLAVKDPIFGKMRSVVEKDLNNLMGIYYHPPIDFQNGTKTHTNDLNSSHRRAVSEPRLKNPIININTRKNVTFAGRNRSSSVLSFEGIQQKISGLSKRLRQSSNASNISENSTANVKPAPSKKKFGFKKALKKLMSRGQPKDLPSPPLVDMPQENERISHTLEDVESSAIGHSRGSTVESSDNHSRATSVSEAIDYSNPNRRVVYETSNIEESAILESVTEISETNTPTLLSTVAEEKDTSASLNDSSVNEISEHTETQKEQEQIVNFSDEDVSSIPAQWPQIKQKSENEISKAETKPEAAGRSSEASFNFSDLSDISEPSATKKMPVITSTNFSDEEDNDEEIINTSVILLEKSNVLPNKPVEDESLDISELLDQFSSQIAKAPSIEKLNPKYDDELDIESFDI